MGNFGAVAMKGKIVLIESDRQSEKLIKSLLSGEYDISSAANFADGYALIVSTVPDMVIIDPLFPKLGGIRLIKALREWSECPVIAVSSNGTERAAVQIMESGADDFIRKPFFSKELAVRVERCFHHIELLKVARGESNSQSYRYNGLFVDFDSGEVTVDNKKIRLTKSEFKILSLLCKNAGKVLTYDYILKSVWGPVANGNTGVLRVNIRNLRKKTEQVPSHPKYILTENGVGYTIGREA